MSVNFLKVQASVICLELSHNFMAIYVITRDCRQGHTLMALMMNVTGSDVGVKLNFTKQINIGHNVLQ